MAALLDDSGDRDGDRDGDRVGDRVGRADADCRTRAADSCRTLRASLLGYRDGAKVFSGTRFTDTTHAGPFDSCLRAFADAGFAPGDAVQAYFTAYSFTIGFVIEEQAVYPRPGERDPRYDPAERAERIGGGFTLASAAGTGLFCGYDERFETGLRVILAGIEATLAPSARA